MDVEADGVGREVGGEGREGSETGGAYGCGRSCGRKRGGARDGSGTKHGGRDCCSMLSDLARLIC